LKALKNEDKSFSDVVLELTESRKKNLGNLIGKGSDYSAEELIKDREEEEFTDERREDLLR